MKWASGFLKPPKLAKERILPQDGGVAKFFGERNPAFYFFRKKG